MNQRSRAARFVPLLLLASIVDLAQGGWTAQSDLEAGIIHQYAMPFLAGQNDVDGYQLGPTVQRHMKAQIAVCLAGGVTGTRDYLESAYGDLQWVIANRLESDGGLNWNGPQNPYFFEVHQHWFLTASELIRSGLDDRERSEEIRRVQRRIWRYLTETNPGGADFYLNNQINHGPFFAYRDVDRSGRFQTQAPFKGSYEIGAALWSFALHRDSAWLDLDESDSGGVSSVDDRKRGSLTSYLDAMTSQVSFSSDELGFVEPHRSMWVRSLRWNGGGWSGFEPHDWKYTLHMQEGAILNQILTGDARLQSVIRSEVEHLLERIDATGAVEGIPDGYGSAGYEYGEVLSVLGLTTICFLDRDLDLAMRALRGGQRVARYAIRSFPPQCTEDGALLLGGFSRLYEAQTIAGAVAVGLQEDPETPDPVPLRIWPNPSPGSVEFRFTAGPLETGWARILDIAGRERGRIQVKGGADGIGLAEWNRTGHQDLPQGRYNLTLEIGGRRSAASFLIVR